MIRLLLARTRCRLTVHAWARWSDWENAVHQRSCVRCPAVEVQRDGKQGVIHVP